MKETAPSPLDEIGGYRAWVQVVKTYQKCHRLLTQRLAPLGITVASHEVLLAIARDEGLSQNQLARHLLVAKSNVTGLLNRLGKSGLVERRPDPQDARSHCIHLTASGHRLLTRAIRVQAEVVALMIDACSPTEVAMLDAVMRKVGARLDAAGLNG